MLAHPNESPSLVEIVVGGIWPETKASVAGDTPGRRAILHLEGRFLLKRSCQLLQSKPLATNGVQEVAKLAGRDLASAHEAKVSALVLAFGKLARLLLTALISPLLVGLSLPPLAWAFLLNSLPNLEKFRLQFRQFLRMLFGEIVFLLPVLLDFIKLELLKLLVRDNLPIADPHRGMAFCRSDMSPPKQGNRAFHLFASAGRKNIHSINRPVGGNRHPRQGECG